MPNFFYGYGPSRNFELLDISSTAHTFSDPDRIKALVCWHDSASAVRSINVRAAGSATDIAYPVAPGAPQVVGVAPDRVALATSGQNVHVLVLYY